MATCRYPHPKFYLPVDRPSVGPDGKTTDGRELISLPPPGTMPACMRKQVADLPARWDAVLPALLLLHETLRFRGCLI